MDYEDDNQEGSSLSKYECLLFDLDDTLYPLTSGLSAQVTKNIQQYMLEKLGIEKDKVPEICVSLYKHYGTTMAGLKAIGYNFNVDDFHSFVHGSLPYTILKPDDTLRNLLLSVPLRKVIFTNADRNHAARAINALGLEDCFERIICFETLNATHDGDGSDSDDAPTDPVTISSTEIFNISDYSGTPDADLQLPKTPVICKPFEESFQQAFKIANINPQKTLFFDDSIRNIQTGKLLGLHTVWIGTSHRSEGVDFALEHIHNIREALPELWETNEMPEEIRYSGKVAIEQLA